MAHENLVHKPFPPVGDVMVVLGEMDGTTSDVIA
jgi:hypothetical protein